MHDERTNDEDRSRSWDEGGPRGPTDARLDELYDLLACARRRTMLSYLAPFPGTPVPLDELVGVVAENEPPDPGPASHRLRIETDLYHVQLPKLTDASVVTFDPAAETVEYEGVARLEALLDAGSAADGDEGETRP